MRIGAGDSEEMPDVGETRIIDYSAKHRTDFGDIYLAGKCKFFVGCSSGLHHLPFIFNVPVVDANYVPIALSPVLDQLVVPRMGKDDLFLPRPIWSQERRRQLTFREILASEIFTFRLTARYEEAGLQVLENPPEDILAATKEMNERLDGCFVSTPEEEELQARFHSLVRSLNGDHDTPARIGTEFIKNHQRLLS